MSSDSENEYTGTPPDIVNTASTISNNLLPQKSKKHYEKAYNDFIEWQRSKRTTSFSENVLLTYFELLSQKYSSASLWTFYSMLKSTLSMKHKVDIAKYHNLTAFLKRKGEGYTAKKSKTFSSEDIEQFLTEAPDQLYLQSKVSLIFGIMGACRRQELYNLQFNDVQVLDSTILVNVKNTKTKKDRTFTITGSYSDLVKKYVALRPSECPEPSFFVHYFAGKCTKQRVGINKFGELGKTIAHFLKLPEPERYTGHCFRRTSATLLADAGGDITTLKRHGGWKCTATAEGYVDESIKNKMKVSNQILNQIQNKEIIINIPSTSSNEDQQKNPNAPCPIQINISNCTTVNVNNYYNK